MLQKIDLVSKLVLEDYEIINQIEAEIRKKISDKKCYIYIEIDEFVQAMSNLQIYKPNLLTEIF